MATQAPTLYFVGGAGLDVVLRVPRFPAEDTKLRVQEVARATGGNACNSAVVAAQVARALAELGVGPYDGATQVHLVAPCASPAHDADARFVADRLAAAAPALATHWVPVGDAGMPVSFVIDAADTASRTILHSRGIRELRADEALAALVGDGGCGGGGTAAPSPVAAGARCPLHWVHIEARSVPMTAALLAALRSPSLTQSVAAKSAGADVVTCIEIEKARADGDVETLLRGGGGAADAPDTVAGAAVPHVAVVSHEYALTAAAGGGGADGAVAADGPSTLARLQPRLRPGTLLVVPWGEKGVYASVALPATPATGGSSSSATAAVVVQVHVPAHPPAFCGGGSGSDTESGAVGACPLVSTLGAGDTFNAALAVAGAASATLRRLWFPADAAAPPPSPEAVTSSVRSVLAFAALVAGEKCGCPSLELGAPLGHAAMRARMASLLRELQRAPATAR